MAAALSTRLRLDALKQKMVRDEEASDVVPRIEEPELVWDEARISGYLHGRQDCETEKEELELLRSREMLVQRIGQELDKREKSILTRERKLLDRDKYVRSLQSELEGAAAEFQQRERYLRALQAELENASVESRRKHSELREREILVTEKEEELNAVGDEYKIFFTDSKQLQESLGASLRQAQEEVLETRKSRADLRAELLHAQHQMAGTEKRQQSLQAELHQAKQEAATARKRELGLQAELEKSQNNVQTLLDDERRLALVETIRHSTPRRSVSAPDERVPGASPAKVEESARYATEVAALCGLPQQASNDEVKEAIRTMRDRIRTLEELRSSVAQAGSNPAIKPKTKSKGVNTSDDLLRGLLGSNATHVADLEEEVAALHSQIRRSASSRSAASASPARSSRNRSLSASPPSGLRSPAWPSPFGASSSPARLGAPFPARPLAAASRPALRLSASPRSPPKASPIAPGIPSLARPATALSRTAPAVLRGGSGRLTVAASQVASAGAGTRGPRSRLLDGMDVASDPYNRGKEREWYSISDRNWLMAARRFTAPHRPRTAQRPDSADGGTQS